MKRHGLQILAQAISLITQQNIQKLHNLQPIYSKKTSPCCPDFPPKELTTPNKSHDTTQEQHTKAIVEHYVLSRQYASSPKHSIP